MKTQALWNVITLVLVINTVLCRMTPSQYPRVLCPEIFEYTKDGNNTFGTITVEDVNVGKTQVQIELSYPGTFESDYWGSLSLNFDKDTLFVSAGSPITYRVNFPFQDLIPQVTAIKINGEPECWGRKVSVPRATLVLRHTLTLLAPNSSFSTQKLPAPKVTRNSNLTRFRIPQSMTKFFDQQTIRLSFEEFAFLDTTKSTTSRSVSSTSTTVFPYSSEIATSTTTTSRPATSKRRRPSTPTSTTPPPILVKPSRANFTYINSVCGNQSDASVPGTLAWIGKIYFRDSNDKDKFFYRCGASLVSTRSLITRASCFSYNLDPEDVRVSLIGMQNTLTDVEKVIQHPDYNRSVEDIFVDIALVQLKQSVTFSNAVRPICMWQGAFTDREHFVGHIGTAVSWNVGNTTTAVSSIRNYKGIITPYTTPKLINAKVASGLTCVRSKSRLSVFITNGTFCTFNVDGSWLCNGDSGNAFMIQIGEKWFLRGTVFALAGEPHDELECSFYHYTVNTDIAKHREWIESQML